MRALLLIAFLILTAALTGAAEDARLVVIASSRSGWIEFFDAETLEPLGSIRIDSPVESVTAGSDARHLYISHEMPDSTSHRCGLFSLDLQTRNMCLVTDPAMFAVSPPGSPYIFTQENQGIEMFEAATLRRVSGMQAGGIYHLEPSPDGHWLFGIANSPQPSLDVFDLGSRHMARQINLPVTPATGAWADGVFYVFGYDGGGRLWSMRPGDSELTPRRTIALPDLYGGCDQPVLLALAGGGHHLFLAESFGFESDRRRTCPGAAAGGIYIYDTGSETVHRVAEGVYVHRLAASADGRAVYAIDASAGHSGATLLRVDAHTGTLAQKNLPAGSWNLSLARMAQGNIPHGVLHPMTSCGSR